MLLFFWITLSFLVVFYILGFFVDLAVDHISPEMEATIFSPIDVSYSEMTDSDNPKEAALQLLTNELRKCVDIAYPLKVYLMESDEANAMALPGGRIIVLSGLLAEVQSENGLSFVLAHELAHFKNRDHLRGLGRGIVLTAMMAYLTGSDSSLTRLFAPAAGFSHARYSQERETMADLVALHTLACHYGHARGATEFFEAMKPEENGNKIGLYFATHPEAVKRIENLHQMVVEKGLRVDTVRQLSSDLSFRL